MRESIIVPGEPIVIGQGWYINRQERRRYVLHNTEGWLDGLPWIVTNDGPDDGYSHTVDDDGRTYPGRESIFDIVRKA